jgi:hypothetical protein
LQLFWQSYLGAEINGDGDESFSVRGLRTTISYGLITMISSLGSRIQVYDTSDPSALRSHKVPILSLKNTHKPLLHLNVIRNFHLRTSFQTFHRYPTGQSRVKVNLAFANHVNLLKRLLNSSITVRRGSIKPLRKWIIQSKRYPSKL